MKKILYLIFKIVIITIILINVFSALNISFLGFRLFRVGSGSMEPNLKVKDLVLIKKSSNYEIGDIVTYKENNEYITHRIISIENDKIVTKGDSNNTSDTPILKDLLVGKVVYRIKRSNFINYLFGQRTTLIISCIILALIILSQDKNERKRKEIEGKEGIEKDINRFNICLFIYLAFISYY